MSDPYEDDSPPVSLLKTARADDPAAELDTACAELDTPAAELDTVDGEVLEGAVVDVRAWPVAAVRTVVTEVAAHPGTQTMGRQVLYVAAGAVVLASAAFHLLSGLLHTLMTAWWALPILLAAGGIWAWGRARALRAQTAARRLAHLRYDLNQIDQMTPAEFELTVRDLMIRDGITARQVGGSNDQAADVIGHHPPTGQTIVAQCKHTTTGANVAAEVIYQVNGTAGPAQAPTSRSWPPTAASPSPPATSPQNSASPSSTAKSSPDGPATASAWTTSWPWAGPPAADTASATAAPRPATARAPTSARSPGHRDQDEAGRGHGTGFARLQGRTHHRREFGSRGLGSHRAQRGRGRLERDSLVIKGDSSNCFGSLDHEIMVGILAEKIHDKAGYLEDWRWHETLSGAPQGGIASPILSNICLDPSDQFVKQRLLPEYNSGRRRRPNRPYQVVEFAIHKARRHGDREAVRKLKFQRRTLPSQDPNDPGYRRLSYVRYCND